MTDVTLLLNEIEKGNVSGEALLPLVYEELRQLAGQRLAFPSRSSKVPCPFSGNKLAR